MPQSHVVSCPSTQLTYCNSIFETAGPFPPRLFLQFLGRQLNGSSPRASSNSSAPPRPLGPPVSKDIASRKKEIDDSDVTLYPQYARRKESISSFQSFLERFSYLKPGESQEIDKSTGSNCSVAEGAISRKFLPFPKLTLHRKNSFSQD